MSESDQTPSPAPRARRPRAAASAGEATPAATPAASAAATPPAGELTAPTVASTPEPNAAPAAPTLPVASTPLAPPSTPLLSTDHPETPTGSAFGPAATTTEAPKRRSIAGPLVAAAAVAALVGGGTGAGVTAWVLSANSSSPQATPASGSQTVTINNPEDVNVVNAVAAKAGPSVVTISVSSTNAAGTGSGVILSDDGYVLTNNHVVTLDGATNDGKIEVTTADGHIYAAKIVGTDPIVDLAVIKLEDASGLTPIDFGDVGSLDVGDTAIAIGAPLGLSNTVTDGIISALNRSIQIASSAVPDDGSGDDSQDNNGQGPFNFDFGQGTNTSASGTISLPVIQTDAAINPGNSGGALVNDQGELIGINVAIASTGGSSTGSQSGSIGVGFAIPADVAQRVAQEIIKSGTATHGLLGATVRDATSDDGSVVGAVVDSVTADGAAAAVGLQKGDVVTDFDGTPITGSVDLTAQVRSHAAGATAKLTYVRDGKSTTVEVTLGKYQAQ